MGFLPKKDMVNRIIPKESTALLLAGRLILAEDMPLFAATYSNINIRNSIEDICDHLESSDISIYGVNGQYVVGVCQTFNKNELTQIDGENMRDLKNEAIGYLYHRHLPIDHIGIYIMDTGW